MGDQRDRCPVCEDDGWVEVFDDEGFPVGARECERLNDPGHAPFNASGLLDGAVHDAEEPGR